MGGCLCPLWVISVCEDEASFGQVLLENNLTVNLIQLWYQSSAHSVSNSTTDQ